MTKAVTASEVKQSTELASLKDYLSSENYCLDDVSRHREGPRGNAEKILKKKAKFEVFEGLIRNLDKNWVWRMRGANFG